MSLIKCPKCGEMFSDSYKTCPFCEEDEAYYSGKVRKHKGRRAAESSKRKAPSILGPVAIVVVVLLIALVVWLVFGDQIKEAITGEKPPVTDVDKPDNSATIDKPDDTAVTPTVSLNRTVLVLTVGDKEELAVNGTEDTVEWSSSAPTVASVTSSGEVTALAKGNAVITASVTVSPRNASAAVFSFCRIMALISCGEKHLPSMGMRSSLPILRLTLAMVRGALVTAWRLAGSPTRRSPLFAKATTDGVVRWPSALGITVGRPPSTTATQLLVVPKSIPMILPMLLLVLSHKPATDTGVRQLLSHREHR